MVIEGGGHLHTKFQDLWSYSLNSDANANGVGDLKEWDDVVGKLFYYVAVFDKYDIVLAFVEMVFVLVTSILGSKISNDVGLSRFVDGGCVGP